MGTYYTQVNTLLKKKIMSDTREFEHLITCLTHQQSMSVGKGAFRDCGTHEETDQGALGIHDNPLSGKCQAPSH